MYYRCENSLPSKYACKYDYVFSVYDDGCVTRDRYIEVYGEDCYSDDLAIGSACYLIGETEPDFSLCGRFYMCGRNYRYEKWKCLLNNNILSYYDPVKMKCNPNRKC